MLGLKELNLDDIGMIMAMKLILIATALIMVGCAVFPSTTSISANSKLDKIDNPNIKVQQNFRWYRQ